jgi:hypothetical protein
LIFKKPNIISKGFVVFAYAHQVFSLVGLMYIERVTFFKLRVFSKDQCRGKSQAYLMLMPFRSFRSFVFAAILLVHESLYRGFVAAYK